ncbi:MAG: diguanylate cyclase [gamma proteobacterium symbiont of Bathyaustriella thionipta]|nr:diguanylate cyclase [gamma proteobacterium symbiont of Bathyaustriella thionipta]MCU7949023.1 diguanylate cyclase [gamma proteobacterium symbiont of Bathyaustriella thionipta]MCU7954510.1 diguanylate cyclase [gamma proteobacterium symbiont of Bathyaustriella thionipta]MCU7955607.1 diguanylate cyclase [gamma proteobacterium symbiont of Bathyaustriella thionipta]MCU7967194.1 diguanylate cyclase [gamma proteobacterium symbiont of Bathyaustriella thionipta]
MNDTSLKWKQKYYDSLDELERREKKWESLEDLFKQAISRLTIAAEGNSKNLDNDLGQLRTAIRKGKDNQAIQLILESVSKEIVKLDKMTKDSPKGDAGFLLKIIEQLQLSGKVEKKSRNLVKQLKSKTPPEQKKLVGDFTELLSELVQQAILDNEANGNAPSGGFFKNLFSGHNNKPAQAIERSADKAAPQAEVMLDEVLPSAEKSVSNGDQTRDKDEEDSQAAEKILLNQEQMTSVVATVQNVLESIIEGLDINEEAREQLKDKIFEVKPTKEIHVLLDDLQDILKDSGLINCSDDESLNSILEHNDLLIRLIEFLPLEEDVKEKAEQLKEDFSHGVSTEELPQALKSIAELISKMRHNVQREQKEFENFLKKLTGRLEEVDNFLLHNLKENKNSYQSGVDLDNAVKEQVKDIGHTVSSINNIEEMEQAVQLHLDKILSHINSHRSEEDERVARVEKQNQELSAQLKQLEGESSKLRQQVITSQNKALIDPLTQLPNRMAYDERLRQEFARWKRYNSTLLIMVWDIDFFKQVNDNYGHQAGDKVLKVVSDLLQKNLRETDFIARYGGEEFVGLMPETSLAGGYKIAEKIRSSIESLGFHYRDSHVSITISCGISLFIENDTPEMAFNRADKALYQAKDEGRNRCVIIEPGK